MRLELLLYLFLSQNACDNKSTNFWQILALKFVDNVYNEYIELHEKYFWGKSGYLKIAFLAVPAEAAAQMM